MKVAELLTEGAIQIMGRKGNKLVRKYRCTSGSRKGRIVAKPATCNAPKRIKSMINIKKAKARKGSVMKVKSSRTKRARGTTQRLTRINKSGRRNLKNIKPKIRSRKRKR